MTGTSPFDVLRIHGVFAFVSTKCIYWDILISSLLCAFQTMFCNVSISSSYSNGTYEFSWSSKLLNTHMQGIIMSFNIYISHGKASPCWRTGWWLVLTNYKVQKSAYGHRTTWKKRANKLMFHSIHVEVDGNNVGAGQSSGILNVMEGSCDESMVNWGVCVVWG
jgi:hypothetical protein